MFFTVFALAWQKYFYVVEKVIFWLFAVFSIIMLVVARLHYLNDVIIAVYIIVMVWHIYHLYAEAALRRRNPIIAWLESDINRVSWFTL